MGIWKAHASAPHFTSCRSGLALNISKLASKTTLFYIMASARLIRRASSHNRRPSADIERTETDPLLSEAGAEIPDDDDRFSIDPHKHHHFYPNPFADLPVYDTIWKIRRDILDAVNDPYTYDQLRAPRLTTAVVRPLLDKYYALQDLSIVFCLLVNRVQFLRDGGGYATHVSSLRATRATLCEMLALRLLRQFDEDSSGSDGLLLLTNIVIAGFDPFQNAPSDVCKNSRLAWAVQDRGGYERQLSALEVRRSVICHGIY